jgi:hypothetical protein
LRGNPIRALGSLISLGLFEAPASRRHEPGTISTLHGVVFDIFVPGPATPAVLVFNRNGAEYWIRMRGGSGCSGGALSMPIICAALPKSWDWLIQVFVRPETSLARAGDPRLASNLEHGIAMTTSKEKSDA